MMDRFLKFFLSKPKIVNLTLLLILLFGAVTLSNLKRQAFDSIDFGIVTITTLYPGAAARDVETRITNKIEDSLKTVDNIKKVTSVSMENFSFVEVLLMPNTDGPKAESDIQKAIDRIDDFPVQLKEKPLLTLLSHDIRPLLEVAITGDADYKIKRQFAKAFEKTILTSPLIARVEKMGYLKQEVKIEADQKKLASHYVSLADITYAIASHNFRRSVGDLVLGNQEKKYTVQSEFEQLSDVGDVIIRSGFDGQKVIVSDIAKVFADYEESQTTIRFNGNESINLVAIKKSNADMIKAADKIKILLNNFQKKLPDNVQAVMIVDHSEDITHWLKMILNNALLGFVLVLIVLFLMLNFRIAFWTAMGIPTSIFIALVFFPVFGVTMHTMTLTAMIIVLGMLVDDAIIIGENIFRYREQGLAPTEATVKGIKEIFWPVVTTVTTTILVFLPILGMTGTMGKIFSVLPIVIGLLLLASLLEGFFFLPTHIAHAKIKKSKAWHIAFFKKFEAWYETKVLAIMKHKGKTILIFTAVLFSAILLLTFGMKFIFFDMEDSTAGYIQFKTKVGTSLEETADRAKQIEAILKTWPKEDMTGFVTTIGQEKPTLANFGYIDKQSSNVGNMLLHFTSTEKRERTATEIVNDIREAIKDIKGFEKLEAQMYQDGPPVGRAVTVTFVSNDDKARQTMADTLKTFLKEHDGVSTIEDNQSMGKDQIAIKLDYSKMARLGLNATNVADTIQAAFEGMVATTLRYQGEDIDYRVILNKPDRASPKTLKELTVQSLSAITVQNKKGNLIPLGQFIHTQPDRDPLYINHYDGDRAITVFADVDSTKITSKQINSKIKETFEPLVLNYPDMHMQFGGEEKEVQQSMQTFMVAMGMAIVAIYFVLVMLFNSFTQPFLVMVAIPFSIAGVIFTFFFHGLPMDFMAMIGFIGLTGVVVNDSLIMITFMNKKYKESGLTLEGMAEAAKHRLRPIILTTVTTAAGLFPMAYGMGGDTSFLRTMILAIAWGLIFATFITLVLVPALYVWQTEMKLKFSKKKI